MNENQINRICTFCPTLPEEVLADINQALQTQQKYEGEELMKMKFYQLLKMILNNWKIVFLDKVPKYIKFIFSFINLLNYIFITFQNFNLLNKLNKFIKLLISLKKHIES